MNKFLFLASLFYGCMSKPKLRTSSNYLPKCSITERVKNNINTRKAIFFTALSADMKVKFGYKMYQKRTKARKKERKKIGDCFFRPSHFGNKRIYDCKVFLGSGKGLIDIFH